jgi:DNA-binding NarL/FixJ family response regulator
MPPRRVLIVDDHEAFLASARALLTGEGFHVVSCAATGEEALSALASLQVDVVLVDLYLPGIDGVTVAERIAALRAPPDVILISSHEDAPLEPRVATAPVRGFLAKRDLAWEAIERLLA